MKARHLLALSVLASGLLLPGCRPGSKPDAGLRPTNVEVCLVSQSSFQAELVPCG